jgi:hypothetical protein
MRKTILIAIGAAVAGILATFTVTRMTDFEIRLDDMDGDWDWD